MSGLTVKQHLTEQGLLDRFSDRAIAWAEKLGIRWIELEGELWTLVSELERKKGVEAGDFVRDSKLKPAHEVKPHEPAEALQRLLQVPGIRKASIPTAFEVEGGYALSCGGPGAKAGITSLVRQQIPEWALAGYTLVNVPLALSYLQHGRTEVAKATRDLTIGTTVDVGKAAAAQQNAPLAVMPFAEGGSTEAMGYIIKALQCLDAEARRAVLKADYAQATAEAADQKAERALQHVQGLTQAVLKPARKKIPSSLREKVHKIWKRHFYKECPCCHKQVSGEQGTMQIDHFYNHNNDLNNLWLVCLQCNQRMGKPGPQRPERDRRRFATWQDRAGMQVTQISFIE